MRKFLLTTALIAVGSPAFAADLPNTKGPLYAPPPPPVFTWTGIYFGANVGYGFSDPNNQQTFANDAATQSQLTAGTVPAAFPFSDHGIVAGGQLGANYELPLSVGWGSGVVVGVESDFQYTGIRNSSLYVGPFGTFNTYHQSLTDLGTVRGRVGLAFDRLLVYATGGFAYGEVVYAHSFLGNGPGNPPIWSGSQTGMQDGYVFGGGVEYALPLPNLNTDSISIRAEVLHYNLGTGTATLPFVSPPGFFAPFTDRYLTAGNIVRAGLNYKFDFFEPAPVVSKY